MRKFIAIILLLGSFMMIFGACGSNGDQPPQANVFYIDKSSKEIGDLSVSFTQSEYGFTNTSLQVRVVIKNNSTDKKTIHVSNVKIVHEPTNVEYDVSVIPSTKVELPYGIEKSWTLSVTIPESYKTANYVLSFNAGENYKFYLYEMPDEFRDNCVVRYSIGGNIVSSDIVKEGRKISSVYVWESSDHISHCKKWYTDQSCTTEFNKSSKISSDITLYGRTKSNLAYTNEGAKIYITGINHVPSDGVLVVPKFFPNDGISLSNFAFKDNNEIKEIYFPIGLNRIYTQNFKNLPNLKKIHYAGTQQEWEAIQTYSEVPSNVIMVYNSEY